MPTDPSGPGLARVVRLALLLVLAVVLVQSTASSVDGRLVALGERFWPGYALSLRADPEAPLCDLEGARAKVATCVEPVAAAPSDDPFATPADDPFADKPAGVPCPAAKALLASCEQDHAAYAADVARLTPAVRAWRAVDRAFDALSRFAYGKHLLSIVLLLGGLQATWLRTHIALRTPHTRRDHAFSQAAQLVAHALLAISAFADWRVGLGVDVGVEDPNLPLVWAVGFAALAVVNVLHLARPAGAPGGAVGHALLSVPLYAWMVALSGAWFLGVEHHPSGQAIQLHRFAQFPSIYLAVALYVWAGMLLERTTLPRLVFDLVRPWQLPPALPAFVVVVAAAAPTAYSGASGIFVIAAGGVIYEELRRAGASRQTALMTTAMSGSLGVVLRPCLVVVLVAALNKEVTTDQLFAKGLYVFALTATLFLVAALLLRREPLRLPTVGDGLRGSVGALRPLLPYVGVGAVVIAVYALGLDTPLNERSAPWILPILLLAFLGFERRGGVGHATGHAAVHVGALLFLMMSTVCLGGLVERSEVMALLPEAFGGRATTMAVLVVIMVLVGMTMDAMGAVILVSVTVADIAYRNGIDPVHFWMMVLVAFELGYLTPPVALNHLLARQVVGDEADALDAEVAGLSFWRRHEHTWVPMAVMGTALLLVAFVPLAWS